MRTLEVKKQKVFVTLEAVTALQQEYLRLVALVKECPGNPPSPITAAVARGVDRAIHILGLPIDTQGMR
jgi:hypothetical protein